MWSIDKHPKNPNELLIGGQNKLLIKYFFDPKTNKLTKNDTSDMTHSKSIRHALYSPDGCLIAAASFDGTITLWMNNSNEGIVSI